MHNPFNGFPPFIGAIFDHLFTLLAGCTVTVLIGIFEKRVLKRAISLKVEIAILLCFVFFACFQAWHDQYLIAQQVPHLLAVNTDQQAEILRLKTNPPQVQVNVPAPIVNIPAHMAWMATYNTAVHADTYAIGSRLHVSSGCKNLSTSEVAQSVACVIGIRVVETKMNPENQPIVTEKVEDRAWSEFKKDFASTEIDRKDYGPTEGDYKTVATAETVDEALDNAFSHQKKTIMLFGEYSWRDGLGMHTNDYCVWMENTPTLFSGGKMGLNTPFAWHSCKNHHGLQK
jgi:hypothetical protein